METCPNCSNKLFPIYNLNYKILKCDSCKLQVAEGAFFNNSFASSLNEEAREHALKNLRINNFEQILSFIKQFFKNNKIEGLEVGCSYGWFLDLCKKNQIKCLGIEPEIKFNDIYINNGHRVINGFYPDVLENGEIFDFIIFNDVLEHIPDINKVMNANRLHLKPNGLLIVNIPIQNGLFHSISKIFYHIGNKSYLNRMWQFNFHSPHLYYFTKKSLTEIAQRNNFKLRKVESLKVIEASQIKNRVGQDKSMSKLKVLILTALIYFITPLTWIKPDTYCFFFEKEE